MSPARQIHRGDYSAFWQKAQEFRRSMEHALDDQDWNALGLNAVHCAISANDALLAFYGGAKASGSDHREAIGLLTQFVKHKDAPKNATHLKRVIAQKSLIEYEGKLFPSVEAKDVYQHALRFYTWAAQMLNQSST